MDIWIEYRGMVPILCGMCFNASHHRMCHASTGEPAQGARRAFFRRSKWRSFRRLWGESGWWEGTYIMYRHLYYTIDSILIIECCLFLNDGDDDDGHDDHDHNHSWTNLILPNFWTLSELGHFLRALALPQVSEDLLEIARELSRSPHPELRIANVTFVALKALEKPGAKPTGQTTPAKGPRAWKELRRVHGFHAVWECFIIFFLFVLARKMSCPSGSVLEIFGDHLHYEIKEKKTNTADLLFQSVNFWNLFRPHFPSFQELEARWSTVAPEPYCPTLSFRTFLEVVSNHSEI